MKHIKKIDDIIFEKLHKSTYMNAHDKLSHQHKERANKLKDWAMDKGKSEFSKMEADRVWPHKFVFSNYKSMVDPNNSIRRKVDGYFSIVGMDIDSNTRNYRTYNVSLMSDYGRKLTISLKLYVHDSGEKRFTQFQKMMVRWGEYYEMEFSFENRIDALQFKRYIVEEGLPDMNVTEEEIKFVSLLSVNQLYTTN